MNDGKAIEFSDNCYLLRHDKGVLLWDTGVPDAVAVPSTNVNKEQTLASLQRIGTILDERKAQLWINHDKPQSDTLKYAPAYYE